MRKTLTNRIDTDTWLPQTLGNMANQKASEVRSLSNKHLLRVYPYSLDLIVERGEGTHLFDIEGKRYLDFATGIGVNILGYGDSRVMGAVTSQLEKMIHASNLYITEPQVRLAEALSKASGLDKVFFVNSGAEANETAFKIARAYGNSQTPKRTEIICFEHGWHGRTIAAISATGSKDMQEGFEPLVPDFKAVRTFDLEAIENAITPRTIALFFEPILGHGGILPAPNGFLREARALCDRHNILLVLDEVQSGLGRTGHFLRYQSEGIVPDIVTLAKGLAGGLPIGATLLREKLAATMGIGSHGATFGGNPVSAAAALEVISKVSNPTFLEQVKSTGAIWLAELNRLQKKYPEIIKEARGVGLMTALIVNQDRNDFARKLAKNGLLCTTIKPNCVRFLPALIITEKEVREAVAIIEKSLGEM